MLGRSIPEYIFIRICVFCLRAVTPLSILYTTYWSCLRIWGHDTHCSVYSTSLVVYAGLEASFYFLVYLPRHRRLQEPAVHPPVMSREEREALFSKCVAQVQTAERLTGWFHPAPTVAVKRGNVIEWLLWALFSAKESDIQPEWDEELSEYVRMLEDALGRPLEPGRDDQVRSMRVSMDNVVSTHRPLLWYLVVGVVDACTSWLLHWRGFRHYSRYRWFSHFPPRFFSRPSNSSPHPRVSYWYRPHKSSTKAPIVFLHGIGIGLFPYCSFFAEVISADPDVGFLIVENLNISMRISPRPLDREEMLSALTDILNHHGLEQVVIVGHSYGTVVAAHILRDPVLSARVKAWLFIDPIPFLLHLPAVAYNFVYRKPKDANEWMLWYFTSRDLDIAYVLGRHFFWAQNVLWKEDLEGKRVGVSLSEEDQIVDTPEVWKYLTGQEETSSSWRSDDLEVLFYHCLDHAAVFDAKHHRRPLVDMLVNFCSS